MRWPYDHRNKIIDGIAAARRPGRPADSTRGTDSHRPARCGEHGVKPGDQRG
jgi:hypothetical protein